MSLALVTLVDLKTGTRIGLSSKRVFDLAMKLLEAYNEDTAIEISLCKELFIDPNKKYDTI